MPLNLTNQAYIVGHSGRVKSLTTAPDHLCGLVGKTLMV